uniref:Uncharacterized protein n=1 Tax=Lotus japonicus TaxID=34305 RepID=I3SZK6_LOTJA|nr:unknown [Lotus japonicus]
MLEEEVNNKTNVEALIICRNNYTVLVFILLMLLIHSNPIPAFNAIGLRRLRRWI